MFACRCGYDAAGTIASDAHTSFGDAEVAQGGADAFNAMDDAIAADAFNASPADAGASPPDAMAAVGGLLGITVATDPPDDAPLSWGAAAIAADNFVTSFDNAVSTNSNLPSYTTKNVEQFIIVLWLLFATDPLFGSFHANIFDITIDLPDEFNKILNFINIGLGTDLTNIHLCEQNLRTRRWWCRIWDLV